MGLIEVVLLQIMHLHFPFPSQQFGFAKPFSKILMARVVVVKCGPQTNSNSVTWEHLKILELYPKPTDSEIEEAKPLQSGVQESLQVSVHVIKRESNWTEEHMDKRSSVCSFAGVLTLR